MDDQNHIIQKQVFDIQFMSDQKPFELQNRVSNLFYSRIEKIMLIVLDQMIPEGLLYRFNLIELDLGVLPYDRMEELLPLRLQEALEKELKDKRPLPAYYAGTNEDSQKRPVPDQACLELLSHFLLSGNLPWWASGPLMTDPEKTIGFLFEKDAGGIKQLLLKLGAFSYVRKRMAWQFSEQTIRSTIEILEPEEAAFIFKYHRAIEATQKETQQIKGESREVSRAIWFFIFTYLLVERGSNFNRKDFVKSNLRKIAEHYNLHYEELLKLFSAPLYHKIFYKKHFPLLGEIIVELSREQFSDEQHRKTLESPPDKTILQKEKNLKKQRLIARFLQSGTLPSWAADVRLEQLNTIFFELIQEMPKETGQLIRRMEHKESGIENIVFAFGMKVITGIIKLVEPAHAPFILNYMKRIQIIHNQKAITTADNQSFSKSIRQFVLNYLLIDKGSTFSKRVFLEDNIHRIANRYNLRFNILLNLLTEAIGERYGAENTSLFHLLKEIQKVNKNSAPGKKDSQSIMERDEISAEKKKKGIFSSRALFDLLGFWIKHGYFPWWGKKYEIPSPEVLWEKLYTKDPAEIIKWVQYAGTEPAIRKRLVYQLPASVFVAAFSKFPRGKEATGIFQFTSFLYERLIQLRIKNKHAVQNILLLAWWDTFILSNYRDFNPETFISLSIQRLAGWTGWFVENIRQSLLKVSRDILKKPSQKWTPVQKSVIHAINKPKRTGYKEQEETPDIRTVIRQYLPIEKRGQEEEILREALRILEYYLSRGQWPVRMRSISYSDIFLKNLLRLLSREKPAALHAIFGQQNQAPAARIKMHDLFSLCTNAEDHKVQELLKAFRQKDLLQYFSGISGLPDKPVDKDFFEIIDNIIRHPSGREEKKVLSRWLSAPALSAVIAEKYKGEIFYRLIENTTAYNGKETASFLKEVQQLLVRALPDPLERESISLLFRKFSLHYFIGKQSPATPSQYFSLLIPLLSNERPGDAINLFRSLLGVIRDRRSPKASLPPGLIGYLEKLLEEQIKKNTIRRAYKKAITEDENSASTATNRPPVSLKKKERLPNIISNSKPYTEVESEKEQVKDFLDIEEDTIYIQNAGLVLLHPFLTTYFNRTGLTKESKFIDEEAVFKAVHLSQFLVDGKENHPEQTLILNKILCGLPLEEPVPAEMVFTEQEKTVSMELLKVVLERWEKLKNTSIEGFRTSFLQREGALTNEEHTRKLRVAQRGYDVLLQTLPWGIGLIKTPWMDQFLNVEWA